jgi:hypothetical protein
MKKLFPTAAFLFVLLSAPSSFAGIPSLVGKWTVKAEGAVMIRGKSAASTTHWERNQTSLMAEVDVTSQQGRVIHGVFKSNKATEPFVAVIGLDKSLCFADQDGFLDGKIINKNTIQCVYRHVTAKDTVVAVGVWTRQK